MDKSRTSLIEKAIELYFDKLDEMVATKLLDLQKGNFSNDKALSGKHKGKYRKRAGDCRIIYLRENELVLITIIRAAYRREGVFS